MICTTRKEVAMNSKIRKLERNRWSILTDDLSRCYECGKPAVNKHEVFEGSYRIRSMENGMVLPLCYQCHMRIHYDKYMRQKYQEMFQAKFEETHTREEFIKLFVKSKL